MRTRTAVSIAVAVAAALAASGCGIHTTWRVTKPWQASLGATTVALYAAPQGNGVWSDPYGYVILAENNDKPLQALQTSGVNAARVTWTHRGLFFSDTRH